MDKPNRKTITIKINGNEEAYINEKKKEIEEGKTETGEESAPLLIESAASKEKQEESFDWVIPSGEVSSFEKESVFVSSNLQKKKNNRNERMFQKLFVSIITAVLVGAGFWYIAFRTITASDAPTVNTTAPPIEDGRAAQQTSKVNLPPVNLFFVQGGVFSNREAAEAAKADFVSKGFPAIAVSDGDKTYVALFASDSLENAKAIGKIYKDQGIDVYWKEMTFAGGETKLSAEDAKVVETGAAFYQTLTVAATQHKLGSTQADKEAIETDLKELLAMEAKDENVSKMVVSLKEAAELLISGELSEKAIAQVQLQLLQFVSMYEQLKS